MQSQQADRRAAILEELGQGPISSQSELGERLEARGVGANQATLSRDLAAIGAVKGPRGYQLPDAPIGPTGDQTARLAQAARQYLISATPAQNQVVLRTPPGGADPLAAAIDSATNESILGTLAGDDTILILSSDSRAAKKIARWIENLAS